MGERGKTARRKRKNGEFIYLFERSVQLERLPPLMFVTFLASFELSFSMLVQALPFPPSHTSRHPPSLLSR